MKKLVLALCLAAGLLGSASAETYTSNSAGREVWYLTVPSAGSGFSYVYNTQYWIYYNGAKFYSGFARATVSASGGGQVYTVAVTPGPEWEGGHYWASNGGGLSAGDYEVEHITTGGGFANTAIGW